MSALTSIFNFLYVYIRALFCYVTGSLFDVHYFVSDEQINIARQIILTATNGQFQNGFHYPPNPLLLIVLGVFVVGSIIGLIRRLMR